MEYCTICGRQFNPDGARDKFEDEHSDRNYDNFDGPVCYKCAHEIIEDCLEGHYHEYCDECGKEFDFFAENAEFMDAAYRYDNADLLNIQSYYGKILCKDCAMDFMRQEFPGGGGF